MDQYIAVRKSWLPSAEAQITNSTSQNTFSVSVVGVNNSKNYMSYDTSHQKDKFAKPNNKGDTASGTRAKE